MVVNVNMIDPDKFYYSDATYQLELNLQNKRRELIAMLDSIDQANCFVCYQLKCRCVKTAENGNTSTTDIDKTSDDGPAPPTPEKENMDDEIEAWIKSGKVVAKDTKDIADNEKKILQIKQNLLNNSTAVETFFKSFRFPPKTIMSNKLAEAFIRAKQTKTDYSYF